MTFEQAILRKDFGQCYQLLGSLILYQTEDGATRIEVHLIDETVWLSKAQMSALFDKDRRTISEHIHNIFKENELKEMAVSRNFRLTAADGKNYQVAHYNLDVIISVGYRVSSHRGTQFRIWATERLKEYLIKGFTLDDERLKRDGGGIILMNYWLVFEISVPQRRSFGARFLISTLPA